MAHKRQMAEIEPYLNCPYCPAQSYPMGTKSYNGRLSRLDTQLIKYQCISKHTFYVEKEREKDA